MSDKPEAQERRFSLLAMQSKEKRGFVSFQEWREEFERVCSEADRRLEDIGSLLYQVFDLMKGTYRDTESDREVKEMAHYLLDQADICHFPSSYTPLENWSQYVYYKPRQSLVNFLASKFFNLSAGGVLCPSYWMMADPVMHGRIWRFLAHKNNLPTGSKSHHFSCVKDYIRETYRNSFRLESLGPRELREAIRAAKADVLQALLHTDQLALIFECDDTSDEMISALERFAMSVASSSYMVRKPSNVHEVLSFIPSHLRHSFLSERTAAMLAISLRQVADARLEAMHPKMREALRTDSL